MLTDTFAVNLPRIFKPLVDLYANKDKPLGPATQILADLLIEHSMAE